MNAGTNLDLAMASEHVQVPPLHSWHTLEGLQISGLHLRPKDVVSEDVGQLGFVLGLQEAFHGASWESTEAFVGWCKHSEWAWGAERVGQIGSNNSSDQRGQVLH